MATIENYRLVVSGMMGSVYIAQLSKKPGLMTSNRRKVPKEEFIAAVLQWTLAEIGDKKDGILSITVDDKVVAEIHIKDKKAIR